MKVQFVRDAFNVEEEAVVRMDIPPPKRTDEELLKLHSLTVTLPHGSMCTPPPLSVLVRPVNEVLLRMRAEVSLPLRERPPPSEEEEQFVKLQSVSVVFPSRER